MFIVSEVIRSQITPDLSTQVRTINQQVTIDGTTKSWADEYGAVEYSGRLFTAKTADGKLAGYGTCSDSFYMFLAVAVDHRRQGVAKAITDRVIEEVGGSLSLTCRKNRPAYLFYKTVYDIKTEHDLGTYSNGDPMVLLTVTKKN